MPQFAVGVSSTRGSFWPEMHSETYCTCARKTCKIAGYLALIVIYLSPRGGFALDPSKNLRQYVLRDWTTEQGLPQNTIHAMLQTSDGFLWLGTRGGLARFDGANFIVYKAGAPNSIPGESITGLAEDRDGSLWIGSDGGLTQYHNGYFHNYSTRDGLPDNSIWRIAAGTNGGVWAVTRNSQLFHFDGKTVRHFGNPFAGPQDVNALIEDSRGAVWIATFNGLFALEQGQSLRRFGREDGLAGERVYALALDHQGEIWTAGDGGLTHHSAYGFTRVPIPGLSTATLLAFDPGDSEDGTIWTGSTGEGLFRLSPRGVQRLRQAQGLISDEIYLLYCSRDGSLWLGALNGLNQLRDSAATSYGAGEGLPRSTYLMQRAQGPNGELWFGNGSFMARVRNGVLTPLVPEPVTADAIAKKKASQESARGLEVVPVWVRSSDPGSRGLVLTNKRGQSVISDGTLQQRLPQIPWEMVGSLLITRDGTLWTAGANIGVVAYPAHAPPRSYTVAEGLDNNNVLALAEDAQGDVWAGTISGLNRIRHGIIVRVISSPSVTSINPSADGSLWVSSESGLIYVPPALTPIRVFTQRDGLPTNLIDGVAEDAEGYLWLGTEQGVVRVQKAYLLAPEHQPRMGPVVFGVGDGLRNAQLRLNSVFCSRDGDVWFVTLEELGMIDPHKKQATLLFPIHIDLVKVDDQDAARPPIRSVTVPAGRHRITIDYTIPEFRIPGRIRFRYRLEGWDKDWIDAGTLRDATYTGIPSGRYVFRVTHSDGYGNWSSEERTMNIRVAPYFYQTGWFSTLIALLIVSFVWQLHQFRVARVSAGIDARMQERTRIARELHDTLLQGMLGISMQLYAASQQNFDPGSVSMLLGRASQKLREIAEQSRRAVDDLRSLPSPDSLEAILSRLLQDLPAGIESQVHTAGSSMRLRPLVQIEIERITGEAIANAIRHSGGSSIRLDILYHYSYVFVSISDDGCGMQPGPHEPQPHSHWGITGMIERARSIGGRLRILPNEPRGTVVEISLPGAVAYLRPARGYVSSFWRRVVRVKRSK